VSRRVVSFVVLVLVLTGCGRLSTVTSTSRGRTNAATTSREPVPPLRNPNQYGGLDNVLPNPSFEHGTAPWSPIGGALQLTNATSRVGRTAVRVVASKAQAYGLQDLGALAQPAVGDRYTFSAWIRSADRPKRVALALQVRDETKPNRLPEILGQTTWLVTRAWRHVTVAGRVRRFATTLDIAVSVQNSIALGDAIFVDGVDLSGTPG
jgi:hypothetical protein